MRDVIRKNSSHLYVLMEFAPGLLEREEPGSLVAFLDFFDEYPAEIYWIKDSLGHPDLVRVEKAILRKLGEEMIELMEVDYSRDLLIFFSTIARDRCFEKLGILH